MTDFNKIEFGNKLREMRLKKEYSLEYVGIKINKDRSTVGKYEKGEIIPDIETVYKLCQLLDIYINDLYNDNQELITNEENSKNPFKTNKLYLYYSGFITKRELGKFKLLIELKEANNYVEVKISNYKTRKTVLKGHMLADNFIATIRTENYKPNYPRLETNQIILNISNGTDDIVKGIMLCTNGEYIPNIKKCLVSKKNLKFSNKMLDMLKLTTEEKEGILNNNIWKADTNIEENFEYDEE